MSAKKLIFAVVGFIALIALGIGGYFLAGVVSEQHEENMSSLEGFGSVVTPASGPSDVDDGQGLAPSIGEKKISTTDKIIISLSDEKNKLIGELNVAKEKIKELENQVALLTNYKENNERYSPRLMEEEREFAVKQMTSYLEATSEAEQFNEFQREVMIEQSANVYLDLARRFNLTMTDEDRSKLLKEFLPAYAFCVGSDIGLVANSRQERGKLIQYFKTLDKSLLPASLLEDVMTINTPCLARLNEQVMPYFRSDLQ